MKFYTALGYSFLVVGLGYVLFTQSLIPLYLLEQKDNAALGELQYVSYQKIWSTIQRPQSASGSTFSSGSLLTH